MSGLVVTARPSFELPAIATAAAATAAATTATTAATAATTAITTTAVVTATAATAVTTTTTAVTAAATTAVTTAAATTAEATATTATTAARLALLGFVDAERATVEGVAVHTLDGLRGFLGRAHGDESEAARAARFTIGYQVDVADRSEFLERRADAFSIGVE